MSQRNPWRRLVLLVAPCALAVALAGWWLLDGPPKTVPASAPRAAAPPPESKRDGGFRLPDSKLIDSLVAQVRGRLGLDEDKVSTLVAIPPTYTLDLESGQVGGHARSDLWWRFTTREERYLEARNGALLALIEGHGYDEAGLAVLRRLRYVEKSLRAWGPYAVVRPGTLVAVRTAEGNYAKVQVKSLGTGRADLEVMWLVYRMEK